MSLMSAIMLSQQQPASIIAALAYQKLGTKLVDSLIGAVAAAARILPRFCFLVGE